MFLFQTSNYELGAICLTGSFLSSLRMSERNITLELGCQLWKLSAASSESSWPWWGESIVFCLFNINSVATISIKGHWASLSALRPWGLVSLEFSLSRLWKHFLLKHVRGIQLSCCHKGHCIKKPYLCWVTFHCTGRLANSLWTPRLALWWEWLMWSIDSKSGIQGAKSKTIQANGNLFWAISIEVLSGWLDGMNACWGQTRLSV